MINISLPLGNLILIFHQLIIIQSFKSINFIQNKNNLFKLIGEFSGIHNIPLINLKRKNEV